MGWWHNFFEKRAEDWVFVPLAANRVPEEPKSRDPIIADEVYISATLRSMRIGNVRKMAKKFYGVVHSFITVDHLSAKEGAFQMVTTPTELRKIDPVNLDRVIQVNQPLLGPIPYRGGNVGMELGLFSVEEADLAAPFIDLLQSMGSQAGVSIVSMAAPFIGPLKQGIEALTGTAGAAILEIGVSTNFNPPQTGWYMVVRAPKQDMKGLDLEVTSSDYRLVDRTTKNLVKDYPYMVFTISQSDQRSDWFKLPDLTRPYKDLQDAIRKRDYTAAAQLIETFQIMALTSDDLITKDARRIAKLVKDKAQEVMGGTLTAAGGRQVELPPLEEYPLYATLLFAE